MGKLRMHASTLFLILTGISFLLLYTVLSFNNRLASDDVYFLAMLKKQGFWDCFRNVYNGWSGRWSATAYFFCVIGLTDNYLHIHYFLVAYHILTLLLLIAAIQMIIQFVFLKFLQITLAILDVLVYSILFIACFYFFTFDSIEAWWWLCSSIAYLQGICFLLVGVALILQHKRGILHDCCISLCFIYAGGCMEIYSMIVLSLFLLGLLYGLKTKRWEQWKQHKHFNTCSIAMISFLLSTVICVIAPGNYHRRISAIEASSVHVSALPGFFNTLEHSLFQKKNGVALLLSALWILLGMKLGERERSISGKQMKKAALIGLIPLLVSIVITYLFKIFIMKNGPVPARVWTLTSFFIATWACLLFFLAGYHFSNSLKRFSFLKPLIPACSMIVLFAYVYRQNDLSSKYAKQHDEVINTLLLAKERSEKTVVIHPLPDPGMLVPLYIGDGYIDWTLKEVLDLKCEIIVEK